ncbi:DUF2207 domain-containing protein [Williamsia sp. CHRR-6]|uniref:DUF2207 domain-containing protein n=1 Tax=Williamsia sp. CHRR-6 TaxID=2835871 RepID=UPI001BDA7B45|nr:DUF2207 domain-containing protein [Williamsia sp. CHRR-6]MBT0566630.1 DUF2207 domain-containing protein [Williamsia sp. CHRR-6]
MKRALTILIGLIVATAAMFLPVLFTSGGDSPSEPESSIITDYQATFDVAADGELTATETIDVEFPLFRHGIFRFFDVVDPNNTRVRLVPHDITVTRDGRPERLDTSTQRGGRYVVAKIGDPNTTIDGNHRYELRYRIPGALSRASKPKSGAQFYWNVIPGGWRMPIQQSSITVNLPAAPADTRCAIGAGASGGCTTQVRGNALSISTGALQPQTPVTVQTFLAIATPSRTELPWSQTLDDVFGRSVPWLGAVLALTLLAAIGAALIVRATHEADPAFPLMYAPPPGIGPAQGAFVLTESSGDDLYAATLLELGDKKVVTLDKQNDVWAITGAPGGNLATVDEVSRSVASSLGITPGTTFLAEPGNVEIGRQLRTVRGTFDSQLSSWASREKLLVVSIAGLYGRLLLGVFALGAAALYFFNPFHMSVLGLPLGVFAAVALPVLEPGATTFRTAGGRALWSQLGGFRRVLGTRSSEARFDFSGRRELYTAYIPWAVAFGVADVWAEKYRVQFREEPPMPGYIGPGFGYLPGSTMNPMGSFASDFNGTVDSAISAYQATQRSSSSGGGGGGFSGGGGGGGGGGGSW